MAPFDNNQAFDEGWALFNDGEIQRLDCPSDTGEHLPDEPIFESDEKAIEFVVHQAKVGSAYHQEALSRLHQNPEFVGDRFVESWQTLDVKEPWQFQDGRYVDDRMGNYVCDLLCSEETIPDEEPSPRNVTIGRLIAASPELFRACEMMLDKFRQDVNPGEAGWDAVAAAYKAVAKARGVTLTLRDERLVDQAFGNVHLDRPDVTREEVEQRLLARRAAENAVIAADMQLAKVVTDLLSNMDEATKLEFREFDRWSFKMAMRTCKMTELPPLPPENEWARASGKCVCEQCGQLYYKHPPDWRRIGYGNLPMFVILCNGSHVKL